MSETKFKVLMHMGDYVDSFLLTKGIYSTNKPTLYYINDTIDSLVEKGRKMKDMTGASFITESYFDNLRRCELIEVTVSMNKGKENGFE